MGDHGKMSHSILGIYDQLIGLREQLQDNPMIFMGKSGWFPVIFPLNQSIDMMVDSTHIDVPAIPIG